MVDMQLLSVALECGSRRGIASEPAENRTNPALPPKNAAHYRVQLPHGHDDYKHASQRENNFRTANVRWQTPMSSTLSRGLQGRRSKALEAEPEVSGMNHLYAGVPVANLQASIDWYTRLFGRDPDFRAGDEILWEIAASATLFIEPDSKRAGTGRITFSVAGLDALLASLAVRHIDHEAIETYSNGVRHVKIPDPDGNAIAFAEPPDAA
jgi:catechol 2,3-dioxygenase-like lactoylglutathione lyase family enzyme